MTIPKALSPGEEEFHQHCEIYRLEPEREVEFCPGRHWRFDFAFKNKIAVEIEGGTVAGKGRHSHGDGFVRDCQKYNMAAILGWRVLRFTTAMVRSGEAIDTVRAAVKTKDP